MAGMDSGLSTSTSTTSLLSSSSDTRSTSNLDDPVEAPASRPTLVRPSISVKPEHTTISRHPGRNGKQSLTCIVAVEIPSAGIRERYPSAPVASLSPPALPAVSRFHSDDSDPAAAASDPFAHIAKDLRSRLVDYPSSGLEPLGRIKLFDILRVRKGNFWSDIGVYLFPTALVCVAEEKKRGIRQFLPRGHGHNESGVLKLKGRIYFKHVRRIVDSTVAGELSLTIAMQDEKLDSFILTFKDKSSHEMWKRSLDRALDDIRGVNSPRTPGSVSKLSRMGIEDSVVQVMQSPSESVWSSTTPGLPAPLGPVHTPIDLVLVFSLPSSGGTSTALKMRLVKSTLEFVISSLGPNDRLSVVTFEPGMGGVVKRTPLLCPGRSASRIKLQSFIERLVESDSGFEVTSGQDEKIDVVTGLNHGFDSLLQRKSKNPLAGMIVVNESSDSIKRSAMDLVLARAEAASIPVHTLGYGQNQDPSGLWLISSHTNGTYTFVKDWYHLRDCLAGCLGGLMSIAMTGLKLHLSSGDTEFRCRKVTGAPGVVISSDGKDVDVDLLEMRHGQKVEVLVDMELERSGTPSAASDCTPRSDDLMMMSENGLIDELPVLELDCSYADPGAGRTVSRLSHPVLLTVALTNTATSGTSGDQTVARRRFELVASDSITRALLLVSRGNWSQAQRVLLETSKILSAVMTNAARDLNGNNDTYGRSAARREAHARIMITSLRAIVDDIEYLQDGIDDQRELFDRDHRNFGAQQAVVLRTQRAWTERTATERMYCSEGAREVLAISRDSASKK